MFSFEFINYGTQILHSKDLEDMRDAVLGGNDHEVDCNVSDFCRERKRFDIKLADVSESAQRVSARYKS
ncbi:hypothetical protein [Ruegeria conchae]|uniref:Uncharacterized protein n=1 Tax=Ruegeria conchae TaxID=981384 RepID=A0A497ZNB1_9RHOB|nr:hypothetical protein [Ruegeria conchae]RLK08175.1 hypothetical protein CLV75_1844 [Ruegeria conchae]